MPGPSSPPQLLSPALGTACHSVRAGSGEAAGSLPEHFRWLFHAAAGDVGRKSRRVRIHPGDLKATLTRREERGLVYVVRLCGCVKKGRTAWIGQP